MRGRRPAASGKTKFEWLYAYGVVHPAGGRDLELLLPAANIDRMGAALAEFARWADPAGRKLLVVILDNAGWHMARRLGAPAHVALHPLPSCTPGLRPAEPLWPLVREAVADQGFAYMGEMEPAMVER